jgi:hypothetical protein
MEKNQPDSNELRRFRAEADDLMQSTSVVTNHESDSAREPD